MLLKTLGALIILLFSINVVWAQSEPYGQVDVNQLKISECPFEKTASAMVLFDVADVKYSYSSISMTRHKRIKVLSAKGTSQADIKIEYYGVDHSEFISDVQAETVNLEDGKAEYTPVDKKNIYTQPIDKYRVALVFSFPKVKPGSVIEFQYHWSTPYMYNFPDWEFQTDIPTCFSQFDGKFDMYRLSIFKKGNRPFLIDSAINKSAARPQHIWAMKNVPSYKQEPYVPDSEDGYQRIYFRRADVPTTWAQIGDGFLKADDFGGQLERSLPGEEAIVAKAKTFAHDEDKIAYLFNTVKNTMTWDKTDLCYTIDGTRKAWTKKTGNSTEINLILYRLLNESGVGFVQPVVFSTSTESQVEPNYPSYYYFDKTALICVPDSTHRYLLDASAKRNSYNEIPVDMLGTNVLYIEPKLKYFGILKIEPTKSTTTITYVNADILPSGSLKGTAQLSASSYSKHHELRLYDKLGDKEYQNKFKAANNQLSITSLKLEDAEVDTLPLKENIDFNLELPGSDDKFIYFSPNIFTGIDDNPFASETRLTGVDFRYLKKIIINGRYKIPEGYKVESCPKSLLTYMPDKSITFKRVAGEMEGYIIVNYVIDYTRTAYDVGEYGDLREFYKKMFELLNEQVVLKKT